jgi:hypothetical protein
VLGERGAAVVLGGVLVAHAAHVGLGVVLEQIALDPHLAVGRIGRVDELDAVFAVADEAVPGDGDGLRRAGIGIHAVFDPVVRVVHDDVVHDRHDDVAVEVDPVVLVVHEDAVAERPARVRQVVHTVPGSDHPHHVAVVDVGPARGAHAFHRIGTGHADDGAAVGGGAEFDDRVPGTARIAAAVARGGAVQDGLGDVRGCHPW